MHLRVPVDARHPDVALDLRHFGGLFADGRPHVLAAHRLPGDSEVDVHLRAHVFPDVDLRRETAAGGGLAREGGILEVLGTNTEDDPLPLESHKARPLEKHPLVDLQRVVTELRHDIVVRQRKVHADEVHRR